MRIRQKKSGGCMAALGIGCLVAAILGAIAVGVAVWGGKKAVEAATEIVAEYTATEPKELPPVQLTEEAIETLGQKASDFGQAVKAGTPTAPLVLEGDEVNALLRADDGTRKIAKSIYLTVEDDQLHGQVSMPLDEIGKALSGNWFTRKIGDAMQGRHLNGSASLSMSLQEGRLNVYLESLSANGKEVPAEVMEKIRRENLAKDAMDDPETAEIISKIQSIEIKDGKIVIVPKLQP